MSQDDPRIFVGDAFEGAFDVMAGRHQVVDADDGKGYTAHEECLVLILENAVTHGFEDVSGAGGRNPVIVVAEDTEHRCVQPTQVFTDEPEAAITITKVISGHDDEVGFELVGNFDGTSDALFGCGHAQV